MFLIAGLGNPGGEYEKTRHNVGFLLVDTIAQDIGVSITKRGFQSFYELGHFDGNKVLLLKPQTYMNNSGNAVREAKEYYKIDTENIIVIHDEMDIPLGRIKLKNGGGSAGHKGIKSIISNIGSDNFPRVRIGVGKPYDKDRVIKHVLSNFNKEQNEELKQVLESAKESVYEIITNGIEKAMNRFNIRAENNIENDIES
ncbi:MAG: aminoacyl-tRNA hydrolase [Candidatus Dadabacteria bacterium]|nr:aminoacyl-tRNA hydrolase [Candidatus Dadabacteria bacterium]NIS10171.1 aminoacyl-tRNA hydrolase [Candidatus Dadabacteria bacterium]NIV42561.1 aminoacyl-tRNA hydrolase [Candidatus Dadabacteria bacterium]NIY23083.1 aminoacyl-tRNA hydrolase [Candidatus Dadabacteria bacterium]